MDEIDLMRRLSEEPPDPDGASRQRMAERLMDRIDAAAPRGKRRPSRSVLMALVVAASIAIAGTAIGTGLFDPSARDTVSVQCLIEGSDAIIPATTGDPVGDCAARWRRDTGANPPSLVAYDNGHGGITVMPVDRQPFPGSTPLPTGATQNVSMIEVQESLDDYVAGLNSGCFDNAAAVAMTEQILARFDMADWTVLPAPASDFPQTASSAAPERCVGAAILEPETRTVTLRALGGQGPQDLPFAKLAAKLRSISEGCLSLDAAVQQVRSAAGDLGLSEAAHEFELTAVVDKDAGCTTIDENVGGTIFLILRGPAA
jgi:hypothetical protein